MPCVLAVFGREDALERKSPISRKTREVGHSRETCPGLSPLTQSRECRVSFFCRYRLPRPKANLASATRLGTIHRYIAWSAFRLSSAACLPSVGYIAIPMLPETEIVLPSRLNGSCRLATNDSPTD